MVFTGITIKWEALKSHYKKIKEHQKRGKKGQNGAFWGSKGHIP